VDLNISIKNIFLGQNTPHRHNKIGEATAQTMQAMPF